MPGGHQMVANAARTEAAVPTLFASGDLPVFTASGIDPSALLAVPWYARHTVAAATTQEQAYQLLEAYSGPDGEVAARLEGVAGHPGNIDYQNRVQSWLMAGETAAQAQAQEREWQAVMAARRRGETPVDHLTADQQYDRIFGPVDRAREESRKLRERRRP